MTRALIGIGSNVGDRQAHMALARRELARIPSTRLEAFSRIIETDPVGPKPQGAFLNAAASLETDLEACDLMRHLRRIEHLAGRVEPEQRLRWGPRELDLDLLLFGSQVISQPDLAVPHPWMHKRDFVLVPLAEIAPDMMHPVLGRTIRELLRDLESAEATPGPEVEP